MKTALKQVQDRILRIQSNYKETSQGHNCFGISAKLCDEYNLEFRDQIKDAFIVGSRLYYDPQNQI